LRSTLRPKVASTPVSRQQPVVEERVVDSDPIDPENGQDSEHECNENGRRRRPERDERQSFGAERYAEPTPE
jgi:hypothetical protein